MPRRLARLEADTPPRVLVLVPHEPSGDARVDRTVRVASAIAPTDVVAYAPDHDCSREYDGRVYLERIGSGYLDGEEYRRSPKDVHPFERPLALWWLVRLLAWDGLPGRIAYLRARRRRAGAGAGGPADAPPSAALTWQGARRAFDAVLVERRDDRDAFDAHMDRFRAGYRIAETLYTRGRAHSIPPRVVVCHGLLALVAGVRLKRLFGSAVVYEPGDGGPEALAQGCAWLAEGLAHAEGLLVARADLVVASDAEQAALLKARHGRVPIIRGRDEECRPALAHLFEIAGVPS